LYQPIDRQAPRRRPKDEPGHQQPYHCRNQNWKKFKDPVGIGPVFCEIFPIKPSNQLGRKAFGSSLRTRLTAGCCLQVEELQSIKNNLEEVIAMIPS